MIYYHTGRLAVAKTHIDKALGYDSANVLALIYRAQMELDSGKFSQALRTTKKILSVEKGSAVGHLLRARAYLAKRKIEEAREDFEAALRSNPGLLSAKIGMASFGFRRCRQR